MADDEPSTDPRERFLDQFEPDGDGWLYRFRTVGAAYRVTDAEKDAFVVGYDRGARLYLWISIPIVVVLFAALAYRSFWGHAPSNGSDWVILIVVGQVLRFGADFLIFRAPMRRLRDRVPVAPPVPKPERRRRTAEGIQETLIIGSAVAGLALLYLQVVTTGISTDPKTIWWTVAAGAMLVLAIGLGTYKWVLGRGPHTPSIFT